MSEINPRIQRILVFARLTCALIGFFLALITAKQGQGWLLPVGAAVGFLIGHLIKLVVTGIISSRSNKL